MVTLGQEREKARFPGCSEDESRCPDEVTEAFNTFGSWMVTFGIGAVRDTAQPYTRQAQDAAASSLTASRSTKQKQR